MATSQARKRRGEKRLNTNDDLIGIEQILGKDGELASVISGFAPRQGQIEMAVAVQDALQQKKTLIAEAGTGIGKTFAYLIPAIMSGGKTIVSTGTRHLQDQLFKKDIPILRKVLKTGFNAALLKGRANYLCPYRLEQALLETRARNHKYFKLLRELDDWRHHSESGDRVEFTGMPEDHILWPRVTSTADNCLGQDCPNYQDCYVVKARREAFDADLVVINHHLFFADLALRENGFGELLPIADGVILDEAHQLAETATRFFGDTLSSRRLLDLCKDTLNEARTEAPDMPDLFDAADRIPGAVSYFRQQLGQYEERRPWLPLLRQKRIQDAVEGLSVALTDIVETLEAAAERSKGLQACSGRAIQLQQLLISMNKEQEDQVQWCETSRKGFALHSTPLDIADTFRQHIKRLDTAWILTSATLAVGQDISHFSASMGLEDAEFGQWDSPFDFANNALMLLPDNLPLPNDSRYLQQLTDTVIPIIEANQGGTFFLFTSYRALRAVQVLLENRLTKTLLVQGTVPRTELLQQFREDGSAVLLATAGFWEGVDVRGDALSCVIIDKLPFAPPGDPVIEARLNVLKKENKNPFMTYQVPQAVIALKQGVGRLIRDVSDRGLVVLCDPRLRTKPYGKQFIKSLPPMPVTSDTAQAIAFLKAGAEQ